MIKSYIKTHNSTIIIVCSMVFMLLLSLPLDAIADPSDTLWTRTFGGVRHDAAYSVCPTIDGGFAIAGQYRLSSYEYTGYIVKTDMFGDTIWTKLYDDYSDHFNSVKQTSDNGYVLVGDSDRRADCLIIKTNTMGDTIWTRINSNYPFDAEVFDIVETNDGGYIAVGYEGATYDPPSGYWNIFIYKVNSFGDFIWSKEYGGDYAEYDKAYSINPTDDGNFIVSGATMTFGEYGGYDLFLMKINPEGDSLWVRTFGGTQADYGKYALQTNDGGYIIAGYTHSFSDSYDIYLVKTDDLGDTIWTRTYGGALNDYATSLALTEDNGYLITGYGESYGTGAEDLYLIQVDSLGNLVWTWTYGGINNERGYCIRKYDEECYIIAGYTGSFGAGGRDFWLLNFSEERTTVNEDDVLITQDSYLINNYPNPFNSSTNISYYMANSGNINLSIYNLAGQKMETLEEGYSKAGRHNISWDASDNSSGVYFYKLSTEDRSFTKRMVLLK